VGPYLDADVEDLWLLTFGKAVYDRVTGAFIACTLADVSISRLVSIIQSIKIGETSNAALVRWDDSTVVASSKWNSTQENRTKKVALLGIGVDQATFDSIKAQVDFTGFWDGAQVRKSFKETFYKEDGQLISAYPIPTPPDDYDEQYRPDYMIILTISESEVFETLEVMENSIDEDVKLLIQTSIIASAIGLIVIVGLVISVVASLLTTPLVWMEKVAQKVTNNAGDQNLSSGIDASELPPNFNCSPTTEITDLVTEFQIMVAGFGGSGAAKAVVRQSNTTESLNIFGWNDFCASLYTPQAASTQPESPLRSRSDSYAESVQPSKSALSCSLCDSKSHTDAEHKCPVCRKTGHRGRDCTAAEQDFDGFEAATTALNGVAESSADYLAVGGGPEYTRHKYKGRNLKPDADIVGVKKAKTVAFAKRKGLTESRLFWWIVLAIVVPLLVALFGVSFYVATSIKEQLPTWLSDVKVASMTLEKDSVLTTSKLRAIYAQEIMAQPIRDLHLLTRTAEWLYFGDLERSASFTRIASGTDTCKRFADPGTCPFVEDAPCDCDWYDSHDPYRTNRVCRSNSTDGRLNGRTTQMQQFSVQSDDADPTTGNRARTSFPAVGKTPKTTNWFEDVDALPGNGSGSVASGHSTLYDRVRVYSAMSTVEFPLYNYFAPKDYTKLLGSYIGFEDDGMFIGFSGCDYFLAENSQWKSSSENGAPSVRPELCPDGKYGYDPRCRGWYADGYKKRSSTPVHVTAPYIFSGGQTACSATSTLADPVTGEHVGQVLLDFSPDRIITATSKKNTAVGSGDEGFVFLITPEADHLGNDAVVGPSFSLSGDGAAIADLMLGTSASVAKTAFEATVLANMRNGMNGTEAYSKSDGTEHTVAYMPVKVKTMKSKNPASFGNGVDEYDTLIYSLGISISDADLLLPFTKIEGEINKQIASSVAGMVVLIIVASILVAIVAASVAVSITNPIISLLNIVRHINAKQVSDDMPHIDGGSAEVAHVYSSFEKLYTVVRFSNAALFSGDLDKAYIMLKDAERLFNELDNKRASSIAKNNLANTCLSIYKDAKFTVGANKFVSNPKFPGLTSKEVVKNVIIEGVACFNAAIVSAESDLSQRNLAVADQIAYEQQLANRLFNRGIFLCTTANEQGVRKCTVEKAIRDGVADLLKCKACDDRALRLSRSTKSNAISSETTIFSTRITGLCRTIANIDGVKEALLVADPNFFSFESESNVWITMLESGIKELRSQATIAPNATDESGISVIGRLQELESTLTGMLMLQPGGEKDAAEMAIRMVVEDEYLERSAAKNVRVIWVSCLHLHLCVQQLLDQTHAS
jgi:HAMP domain-containing protein